MFLYFVQTYMYQCIACDISLFFNLLHVQIVVNTQSEMYNQL